MVIHIIISVRKKNKFVYNRYVRKEKQINTEDILAYKTIILNKVLKKILVVWLKYFFKPKHKIQSNLMRIYILWGEGHFGAAVWVLPIRRWTTERRAVSAQDIWAHFPNFLFLFRIIKKKQWSRQFLEWCWARTCSD